MARGFERTRRGVTARFGEEERDLLVDLLTEVEQLLDDGREAEPDPLEALVGITEGATRPEDPALARLLPDAAGQPEDALEFRRYTERGLRERKQSALATARASLQRGATPLVLDEAEAAAWLTALTDVRLVMAERLGVREDADVERLAERAAALPPTDPAVWLTSVYDFLAWLQETLVGAMSARLRHRSGG